MSAPGPAPEDPALAPWGPLREALAGSFSALAHGPLGSELALLDPNGQRFGTLRLRGTEGADVEAGDLAVGIRSTTSGHTMRQTTPTGDAEVLVAGPAGSPSTPEIACGGRPYEVRLRLLRNVATARPAGSAGEAAAQTVRVSGGLTNRAYTAIFDPGDAAALPLAVFLLYHTVSLRRRAYRTG